MTPWSKRPMAPLPAKSMPMPSSSSRAGVALVEEVPQAVPDIGRADPPPCPATPDHLRAFRQRLAETVRAGEQRRALAASKARARQATASNPPPPPPSPPPPMASSDELMDQVPQAVSDIGAWRWAVEEMHRSGIHCVDCSTLRALEYMEGVARPDALPTCERCSVAVRLAQQQEVWPRIRGLPREGQAGMEVGMVDSERRGMWEFRENLTLFRQGRLSAAEAPEAVTTVAAAIQSDMCRSPSPPVRDRPRPPAYPPPAHLLRSRSRSRS